MELRGDRVVLRPLRDADVPAVAAIQAQPAVATRWGQPDLDELRGKAAGTDACTAFAIEVDGAVVGLIQYHEEDDPDYRSAGIDLFLSQHVHGRGLGTDAVRTMARHLIDRGHHRLTIDPAADNIAAIRAYEKVGFKPVGVLRQYERDFDGDGWHDGLLMDLLARELR